MKGPFWTCPWDLPVSPMKLFSGKKVLMYTFLKCQIIRSAGLKECYCMLYLCISANFNWSYACESVYKQTKVALNIYLYSMTIHLSSLYAAWLSSQNFHAFLVSLNSSYIASPIKPQFNHASITRGAEILSLTSCNTLPPSPPYMKKGLG